MKYLSRLLFNHLPPRPLKFSFLSVRVFAPLALAVLALAPIIEAAVPVQAVADIVYDAAAPGVAKCVKAGDVVTLSNGTLAASWTFAGGTLKPVALVEVASGKRHDLSSNEVFRLGVSDVPGLPQCEGFLPVNLKASEFSVKGVPQLTPLPANPNAVKLAERSGGWCVSTLLVHAASGVMVEWSAELRDGSHYARQTVRVTGVNGELTAVQAVDFAITGAREIGAAVAGNPVATDTLFFGVELPMGKNSLKGVVRTGIACKLPLAAGAAYEISSVVGAYPQGQLRRAFLRYLERERAAPYRQFLHYNGWFDFEHNVTEKGTIDSIEAYDRELMKKRGVPVQAFVIDDGWDDLESGFWAVNRKKFPHEFQPIGKTLDAVGSRFGIWISPLGGYMRPGQKRLALAAKEGLMQEGKKELDLSYPPYYKWFLDKTTKLVTEEKVAYFKFDNAGNGVNPHFLALLNICRELRKSDPLLVVNITVGTWPSPFWLNHIDCTWRAGQDMGWEGPGDDRESWITFRDAQTWRGVVSKGPLYPLNSIMTHGVVLSDGSAFAKRALKAGTDMKHEVRSFFGSGTLMQELYVKPAITPPESWDQIAEAAKWSASHADVLVDTHWIGGNPSKGAVYGWAAWVPRKGVITLRNPSDKEATYALDIAAAFELPSSAAKTYSVKGAYADAPSPFVSVTAGKPVDIMLKPFEVLALEFTPAK